MENSQNEILVNNSYKIAQIIFYCINQSIDESQFSIASSTMLIAKNLTQIGYTMIPNGSYNIIQDLIAIIKKQKKITNKVEDEIILLAKMIYACNDIDLISIGLTEDTYHINIQDNSDTDTNPEALIIYQNSLDRIHSAIMRINTIDTINLLDITEKEHIWNRAKEMEVFIDSIKIQKQVN